MVLGGFEASEGAVRKPVEVVAVHAVVLDELGIRLMRMRGCGVGSSGVGV